MAFKIIIIAVVEIDLETLINFASLAVIEIDIMKITSFGIGYSFELDWSFVGFFPIISQINFLNRYFKNFSLQKINLQNF